MNASKPLRFELFILLENLFGTISLQFMRCMRAAASRLLKLKNSKYQDQTDEEIDEENKQEDESDSEANKESEETKEESGEDTEEESYQFHADEL